MLSGTVSTIDTGGFELRGGITPPGLKTQTGGLKVRAKGRNHTAWTEDTAWRTLKGDRAEWRKNNDISGGVEVVPGPREPCD